MPHDGSSDGSTRPAVPSEDRDFAALNPGLALLPQRVLCHESEIRQVIRAVENLTAPIEDKVRLLDRSGALPFLLGSTLNEQLRLFLDVEDDLRWLRIYKLERQLTHEQLNGRLEIDPEETTFLVEIPDPTLMFSSNAVHRHAGNSLAESIIQLFIYGRRITRYRGVAVSWDQAVDRNVWTTNIDTVYFLKQLFRDELFARRDVRRAIEVGVGGSAISKSLALKTAGLEELTVTDINPYALLCAKRNIQPFLGPDTKLNLYLGKGIRAIHERVDLLVVNPPYIPTIKEPDTEDPYRGTGLIKEVLEIGPNLLNPDNPDACIYMGMSSLAGGDLSRYLESATGIYVRRVGEPLRVPLKILNVNENREWIDFLAAECGLIRSLELLEQTGFELWHELSVLKITRQ